MVDDGVDGGGSAGAGPEGGKLVLVLLGLEMLGEGTGAQWLAARSH